MSDKQYPDVSTVRAEARAAWEAAYRKRRSLQEWLGLTVPWWLIAIAVTFFALSAPHTAAIFNMLTPGYGGVAPLGVEFGLLYASFSRWQARNEGENVRPLLVVITVLLFITSVLANGAGAFIAVIDGAGELGSLSARELWRLYPTLPASRQASLLLVPISAFIIPIGTMVVGEGLASLLLDNRDNGDTMSARWETVQRDVEFMALRDAALQMGHTPKMANKWASQVVDIGDVSARPSVSVNRTVSAADRTTDIRTDNGHGTGQGYSKNMSAREQGELYLSENGDPGVSVREFADLVGIGKTTAADILRDYRSNGHSATGA